MRVRVQRNPSVGTPVTKSPRFGGLRVIPPNDRFELEANHIADQILNRRTTGGVRPTDGGGSISKECGKPFVGEGVDEERVEGLRNQGFPLNSVTSEIMETRFGHSFAHVRIHADNHAAETARELAARAFTVGRHIGFGAGEYSPHTNEGQRLVAHELTHVLQQTSCAPRMVGATGMQVSHAPLGVARKEKDEVHGSAVTTRPIRVTTSDGRYVVLPSGSSVGYTADVPGQSYTIYFITETSRGVQSQIHRSWLNDLTEAPWPTIHRGPGMAEEPPHADVGLPDFLSWDPSAEPSEEEPERAGAAKGTGYLRETEEGRLWVSENGFLYYPDPGSETLFVSESPKLFYSISTKKYYDYHHSYDTEDEALAALGSKGELRTKRHVRDPETGEEAFVLTAEGQYQQNRRLYQDVVARHGEKADADAPKAPLVPDQCALDCQRKWQDDFLAYWKARQVDFERQPIEPDHPDTGASKPRARRGQEGRTQKGKHGPKAVRKRTYKNLKDAPEYPKDFTVRRGPDGRSMRSEHTINNKDVKAKLEKIERGQWKKVYEDGTLQGEPVSVHYFKSPTGRVFDVKVKPGWSN